MSTPASTLSTAQTAGSAAASTDIQKDSKQKSDNDAVVVQNPSKKVIVGFSSVPHAILNLIFNTTYLTYDSEAEKQSHQFASTHHRLSYNQKIVDGFNISYPELGETVVMDSRNEPKLRGAIRASHDLLSTFKNSEKQIIKLAMLCKQRYGGGSQNPQNVDSYFGYVQALQKQSSERAVSAAIDAVPTTVTVTATATTIKPYTISLGERLENPALDRHVAILFKYLADRTHLYVPKTAISIPHYITGKPLPTPAPGSLYGPAKSIAIDCRLCVRWLAPEHFGANRELRTDVFVNINGSEKFVDFTSTIPQLLNRDPYGHRSRKPTAVDIDPKKFMYVAYTFELTGQDLARLSSSCRSFYHYINGNKQSQLKMLSTALAINPSTLTLTPLQDKHLRSSVFKNALLNGRITVGKAIRNTHVDRIKYLEDPQVADSNYRIKAIELGYQPSQVSENWFSREHYEVLTELQTRQNELENAKQKLDSLIKENQTLQIREDASKENRASILKQAEKKQKDEIELADMRISQLKKSINEHTTEVEKRINDAKIKKIETEMSDIISAHQTLITKLKQEDANALKLESERAIKEIDEYEKYLKLEEEYKAFENAFGYEKIRSDRIAIKNPKVWISTQYP